MLVTVKIRTFGRLCESTTDGCPFFDGDYAMCQLFQEALDADPDEDGYGLRMRVARCLALDGGELGTGGGHG